MHHNLLTTIRNDAWAIRPEALRELHDGITAADFSVFGDDDMEDEGPSYTRAGDTAIIGIHGPLSKSVPGWAKRYFGMMGYDDIGEAVDAAEASNDIRRVLFQVNSPGGSVRGLPELAGKIRGMTKPTAAYTDGMAASAAYWLASQADSVWLAESAEVGSVGVYVMLMDVTGAYDEMGVKLHPVSAGKHKLDYSPFTPLSDDAKARMQTNVDEWHARFKGEVNSKRNVPGEHMEGQTFEGHHAVESGLADGVALNVSDAVWLLDR